MITKLKSFLMLAIVSIFTVAGMTSCSSDDVPFDENGEINAPALVHKYFGLSPEELKVKMILAKTSLVSEDKNSLVFKSNDAKPLKFTFQYFGGKMTGAEARVVSNNMMSYFKKWDALMLDKKADFSSFWAHNKDLNKYYYTHDEFVADISENTKWALEEAIDHNAKQIIEIGIDGDDLYYFFGEYLYWDYDNNIQ
ncbi:MAG: hypothetical protein J5524_02900 [Bacteroidaceae bacterium]|nr:hypothetical protein [Bacteroidaceae bacterium]